jgi:major membrane immunogen (membrane-anchored lipoprotein)
MKRVKSLVACVLALSLVTACGGNNDDVYNEVVTISDGMYRIWSAKENFDGNEFEVEITSSNNGVIVNPHKMRGCDSSGVTVKSYNKNCHIENDASIQLINPEGGGDELVRVKITKK